MVFRVLSSTAATGNQPQEPHNTQPTDDEWAAGWGRGGRLGVGEGSGRGAWHDHI